MAEKITKPPNHSYFQPPEAPETPPNQDEENTEAQEQVEQNKLETARKIVSTVSLFLAAPLFALVLILFVIQSYEVDGPSMQQTLQNNDLLIVNKLPKTWSRITGNPYIPERGEIIIFTKNEGLGSRQLVKRVIALPGEHVIIKDSEVTVFNSQNMSGFNPDENPVYSQTFLPPTQGNIDLTVPDGKVFVLGDNRSNSLDSRSFGPIDAEEIVGNLGIRLFPLSEARTF